MNNRIRTQQKEYWARKVHCLGKPDCGCSEGSRLASRQVVEREVSRILSGQLLHLNPWTITLVTSWVFCCLKRLRGRL